MPVWSRALFADRQSPYWRLPDPAAINDQVEDVQPCGHFGDSGSRYTRAAAFLRFPFEAKLPSGAQFRMIGATINFSGSAPHAWPTPVANLRPFFHAADRA